MHTTNYKNTLILPSEDCKSSGPVRPVKEGTVAFQQFEMLHTAPYHHTSDDIISTVQAKRKDIADAEYAAFRSAYFSKGQACFRASPLVKTHGWAIHHDADEKVAILDPGSHACQALLDTPDIKVTYGMRNARATGKT